MYRKLLIIILSVTSFVACNSATDEIKRPDVSEIKVDVEITRLEQKLFNAQSKGEIKAFLDENKLVAENFLYVSQYPHDSVVVNQLYGLIKNPSIDTLYRETQQVFNDMSEIEKQFETAFQYIKYYYPEFVPPKIYTMVTGFATDLFISEEVIIIGLDYFLGEGAKYRPVDIPNYILRRYAPEYLVSNVMLVMSSRFNKTDMNDKTMLAEMIYYGKSYYFVDFVVPQVPDSVIIGYTTEEIKGVEENQEIVWAHLLKNELLYETNHLVKKKYTEERPKTLEIGDKAPGRVVTWVGWEIVKKYMDEHEDVTFRELMENGNAREIFNQAKYKPKSR